MSYKKSRNTSIYKKGQYAEIMTECAEHIYRESISKTVRNYFFTSSEGTRREVDVCTILTSGEKIAFEVRDRKSVQSIDWVDQVIGKYLNSPFSAVWLCTFDGCSLSSEAIKKLQHYNIGWRDFTLLNECNCNEKPIIIVRGIEIEPSNCVITVNEEVYSDVEVTFRKDDEPISFIKWKTDECKKIIKDNFRVFDNIQYISDEYKLDLSGIENNIESKIVTIKVKIFFKHINYVDYFNEEYNVIDNNNENILVSTRNKSIFVTNDTLAINFGYLSGLHEEAILDNSFIINLDALPEKFRKINNIKFMDISGEGKTIPMKLYAIKREKNYKFEY